MNLNVTNFANCIRTHKVVTGVILLFASLYMFSNIMAAGSTSLDHIEVDNSYRAGEVGSELIVIVHGYENVPEGTSLIEKVAKNSFPTADFLVPTFPAGAFSNADPRIITEAIERKIAELYEVKQYKKIYLVGFSMGSLIIRKAFLWGWGGEFSSDRPNGTTPKQEWVDKVERIVLLAGMNRGWSISSKDDESGCEPIKLYQRVLFWLGKQYGRFTGTANLILSLERGSPFVADLRVQWIRLVRGEKGPRTLEVIQLLGDSDDVVTHCDNKDVEASQGFVFIPVRQTGHAEIIQMVLQNSPAPYQNIAALRAGLFSSALEDEIEDLRGRYSTPILNAESGIKHVVFVMHGIRDFGEWTDAIEEEFLRRPEIGGRVKVIRSSYGYFSMLRFLLLGARQVNVRWFMDQYTQAIARYPNAKVSYVGHSNGTYLLASALQHYRSLRVHRVLFAGSVVHTRFPWKKFIDRPKDEKQVIDIRNIVASVDLVVGIFPRLFELIAEITPISHSGFFDVGAAGFRGFTERKFNVGYVDGGHGVALDPKNKKRIKAIADYLFLKEGDADNLKDAFVDSEGPPWYADWLSKLCWLVWLALVAAVILLGVGFTKFLTRLFPMFAKWGKWIYVLLILGLLSTL